MKKKFIQISILFIAILSTSCSTEGDVNVTPTQEDFFNLNVGNTWVYKRYNFELENPTTYTFSGITDNVEIVENVSLNGVSFSKLKHTKTHSNNSEQSIEFEYLRVNSSGHLIGFYASQYDLETIDENSGQVYHPGTDFNFGITVEFPYGSLNYSLHPQENIIVENNNYLVLPFKGVFTPSSSELESKTVESNYQSQIGLVKTVSHLVSGPYGWEDRLISYTIVD